jgi:hypothetical protein
MAAGGSFVVPFRLIFNVVAPGLPEPEERPRVTPCARQTNEAATAIIKRLDVRDIKADIRK